MSIIYCVSNIFPIQEWGLLNHCNFIGKIISDTQGQRNIVFIYRWPGDMFVYRSTYWTHVLNTDSKIFTI